MIKRRELTCMPELVVAFHCFWFFVSCYDAATAAVVGSLESVTTSWGLHYAQCSTRSNHATTPTTVRLRGTRYARMIQHSVAIVLRNCFERNYSTVIYNARRSRDASRFCAIDKIKSIIIDIDTDNSVCEFVNVPTQGRGVRMCACVYLRAVFSCFAVYPLCLSLSSHWLLLFSIIIIIKLFCACLQRAGLARHYRVIK